MVKRALPHIRDYVSSNPDLRSATGVLDFNVPSLVGYKVAGNQPLVEFLFANFLRSDVILPGEGGVKIVVDPCADVVVFGNFLRYP